MKKSLILLLFVCRLAAAQEIFHETKLGFQIQKPENWITAQKSEALENLKEQIKLPDGKIEQLIQNNKGTIEVVTFYKYDLKEKSGIIPTIKVSLRKNKAPSLPAFKKGIEASFNQLKTVFPDFAYLSAPKVIKVDTRPCVFAVASYTIQAKAASSKVRSSVYAFPVGDKFYQVVFMDMPQEDCQALFEQIAASVRIE